MQTSVTCMYTLYIQRKSPYRRVVSVCMQNTDQSDVNDGELYLYREVTFSVETDRRIFVNRYAPEADLPLWARRKSYKQVPICNRNLSPISLDSDLFLV
jgi:hypothetical protein